MVQKFQEMDTRRKPLYVHLSCATDTNNVQFTFEAVRQIIIRNNLESLGLMSA
jgi:hypothetical protein